VPALLGGGEFVLRKSSAQSIGLNNLDILNEKPQLAKDLISSPSGSQADLLLANEYFGIGSKTRPTSGIANISSLLSAQALEDENNPQNKLRLQRQQYFQDLAKYNEANKKTLKEFNKAQTSRRISAYVSAATNLAGASIAGASKGANSGPKLSESQIKAGNTALYNNDFSHFSISGGRSMGGAINRYAAGGNVFGGDTVNDNIPAMLMGGEFVFNKQASKSIGAANLNFMNKTGRMPGYAAGGSVGSNKDYAEAYSGGSNEMAKYFADFVSISAEIRDSLAGKSNTQPGQAQTPGIVINNSVAVTVTDGKAAIQSTTTTSNDNKSDSGANNGEQGRDLGLAISQIVTQAIIRESRNGGLLESTFKKK